MRLPPHLLLQPVLRVRPVHVAPHGVQVSKGPVAEVALPRVRLAGKVHGLQVELDLHLSGHLLAADPARPQLAFAVDQVAVEPGHVFRALVH